MTPNTSDTYITDPLAYPSWEAKIRDVAAVMSELTAKNVASRRLRYTEVDVESERVAERLAPDELLIPQHLIDTNIRREQSSYVQYVTQSQRAVVLTDAANPAAVTSLIETDATNRIRFDGWQLPMYANIDGMQQNGYGVMELTQEQENPGALGHEFVQLGDFGFVMDTRDIQQPEIVARAHYFTKTKLLARAVSPTLSDGEPNPAFNPQEHFNMVEVKKIVDSASPSAGVPDVDLTDARDRSLYKLLKVMFRVNGVVYVAWTSHERCDDWVRVPRTLFLGRRQLTPQPMAQPMQQGVAPQQQGQLPPSTEQPETSYPYFLFPYLISENDTISQLKGRAYLDQDVQEAVTSLLSSFCTAHRRASGLYFSKDTSDPDDDMLLQKNVYFKVGALINAKIKQFQLEPPPADMLSGIQALVTSNQNETSQVNFAAQNRKDSRKTAAEINASQATQQQLSTVQVVLFSTALRMLYQTMFDIIQSRVRAGLITVNPAVRPLYEQRYIVKPSGDTDVIERAQLVNSMLQAWPIISTTPANVAFLSDLLSMMFPALAPKYIQIFAQSQAQQQSQQAQQAQQMMQMAQQFGAGIVQLSKHPDYFSDVGKLHAYPIVEQAATMIEQLQKQAAMAQQQPHSGQPAQPR